MMTSKKIFIIVLAIQIHLFASQSETIDHARSDVQSSFQIPQSSTKIIFFSSKLENELSLYRCNSTDTECRYLGLLTGSEIIRINTSYKEKLLQFFLEDSLKAAIIPAIVLIPFVSLSPLSLVPIAGVSAFIFLGSYVSSSSDVRSIKIYFLSENEFYKKWGLGLTDFEADMYEQHLDLAKRR